MRTVGLIIESPKQAGKKTASKSPDSKKAKGSETPKAGKKLTQSMTRDKKRAVS